MADDEARDGILDQSDWFTQTTAVLPPPEGTGEPLTITCLSFSLTEAEQEAFVQIVENESAGGVRYAAAAWLVGEAAGIDADLSAVTFRARRGASSIQKTERCTNGRRLGRKR